MQAMGGGSFGSSLTPPPPPMFLLATKLSFLVNKGLNYVKLRPPSLYLLSKPAAVLY